MTGANRQPCKTYAHEKAQPLQVGLDQEYGFCHSITDETDLLPV